MKVLSPLTATLRFVAPYRLRKLGLLKASALALCLATLAGCAPHQQAQSNHGDLFTVAVANNVTTFDPATCQDVETNQVLMNAYEGLVQYSPDNKVVPCLAEKWDVSPNGLVYTFHLRPGVKFQNGMPVTASDVAFTLRRALDPKLASPVAQQYLGDIVGANDVYSGKAADLKGVKVVDPQTIAITITSPKAYWLATLTYPTAWIVCKAIAEKRGTDRLTSDDAIAGAGTGPFHVTVSRKDQEVDMEPNSTYWDGAPKVHLAEKIILDPNTRHSEFVNGQLDLLRKLTIGDLVTDKADAHLKTEVKVWPRAGVYYIALNENVYKPFNDVRVRQAFAYATDKKKLADVVTGGIYPIAYDILPTGIPGSDPNYRGLPYDPAKAKQLLVQAGYPNGKGLPALDIMGNEKDPLTQKTIDLLRQMYAQNLGVTINERQMEFGALIAGEDNNKTLPSYFLGWYADYLDPQDFYSLLMVSNSTANHTGYSNPKFDALCAQADVEQNAAKRMALYHQAAEIIGNEVPRIPLYIGVDPELISSRTHGIEDCLMGHLPFKHVTVN